MTENPVAAAALLDRFTAGSLRNFPAQAVIVIETPRGTRGTANKPEMILFLSLNDVISNPCRWHDFPPSPARSVSVGSVDTLDTRT